MTPEIPDAAVDAALDAWFPSAGVGWRGYSKTWREDMRRAIAAADAARAQPPDAFYSAETIRALTERVAALEAQRTFVQYLSEWIEMALDEAGRHGDADGLRAARAKAIPDPTR